MSQDSLQRLREDLQTLQAATGLDFPYEPAHVRTVFFLMLAIGVAGRALVWRAQLRELGRWS